jgi:1-deoxy-D-xylulose-5-phosphate reductoisomerase
MNAANEAVVDLFLKEKIRFLDIFDLVQKTVTNWEHKNMKYPNINDIIESAESIKRQINSKYF